MSDLTDREYNQLSHSIERIEAGLFGIDSDPQSIGLIRRVENIERGLYGDNNNAQDGIVDRVKLLEDFQNIFNNMKWYVIGGAAVFGALGYVIKMLIDIMIKKVGL